jgi:hypothetical protein
MTPANRGLTTMHTSLENLIREADEARLEEAVLEATGDDILDHARDVTQTIEQAFEELIGGV